VGTAGGGWVFFQNPGHVVCLDAKTGQVRWQVPRPVRTHRRGWGAIPNFRPSGRILVTDQTTVFGYGRKTVKGNSLRGYHLFRADKQVKAIDKKLTNNNEALVKYQRPGTRSSPYCAFTS